MFEEVNEKTSSNNDKKSKDNNEPPSSHSKYVTHRATFGQIRVDQPSKSKQRQMIESLCKTYDPKSEQNQTFEAQLWSLVDEDINTDEHDIDFYGVINAHYRNFSFENKLSSPKEEITDNYIDQLAFPELTTKKSEIKSTNLQKETIKDLKNEKMNFIDEQYFGTLKQIEYQDEQINKILPTKRIEMSPTDELNYIDQLIFSSPTSTKEIKQTQTSIPDKQINSTTIEKSTDISSDKLLDINFQFRISTPTSKPSKKSLPNLNESPMDLYNPKLESMRSIKSKDYFDPPRQSSLDIQKEKDIESDKNATQSADHIREQLIKKINVRDSLGYRTFENLIPKWWTMTKAEIVDILIKQICFIRHGILALDKPYGLPTIDK
ncbi:unnamed protein product [Rotaria sp. Silwood2]|nr:unnamed protein product [Rotaria sp. Silwood2]